jgi:deoxyhypusine synthase
MKFREKLHMKTVKDIFWKPGKTVHELMNDFSSLGYQAAELAQAREIVLKMKRSGGETFLTFTSNMVTSGLRGFFAQLIALGLVDIAVTTSGAIEEDMMKAFGEDFQMSSFHADDTAMHERGENRIGNLAIRNESYMKFEDKMREILEEAYAKRKRWRTSDLLLFIGERLEDENSILYRAAKKKVPIYCPGIADSSFGFHLFMFQQLHSDFIVDTIQDMQRINTDLSFDERKGLIALGGSISKHYAVFSALLSGGFDYAVYLTTAHQSSGSMSGATTQEAKSWGKIKDDAQAATVIGDVTLTFPLMMMGVLDKLDEEGILDG